MKENLIDRLRDRDLPIEQFRELSLSLSKQMALEVASRFKPGEKVVLVAILRAGLVLLPAFQDQFSKAPIGLIGIRRDERTAIPELYYEKLPPLSPTARIFVLDPMLATGGSANLALNLLKERGAQHMTLISMISAPEGVRLIQKQHPAVSLYTVVQDLGLDDRKFIIPGLGDFGDRYFGTI